MPTQSSLQGVESPGNLHLTSNSHPHALPACCAPAGMCWQAPATDQASQAAGTTGARAPYCPHWLPGGRWSPPTFIAEFWKLMALCIPGLDGERCGNEGIAVLWTATLWQRGLEAEPHPAIHAGDQHTTKTECAMLVLGQVGSLLCSGVHVQQHVRGS